MAPAPERLQRGCRRGSLQAIPPETLRAIHAADVVFLPSFSEHERAFLLKYAKVLVYTPSNEVRPDGASRLGGERRWANRVSRAFVAGAARVQHFGIVPVEAMYAGLPVVAVNSGGPTESILHDETGLLVPPEPAAFADAVASLLADAARREVRAGPPLGEDDPCFGLTLWTGTERVPASSVQAMGRAGRERVKALYSLAAFGAALDRELHSLVSVH